MTKEEIIAAVEPFAMHLAKKRFQQIKSYTTALTAQDLFQAAMLGVLKSISTYDATVSKPLTYLGKSMIWEINAAIRLEINGDNNTIEWPDYLEPAYIVDLPMFADSADLRHKVASVMNTLSETDRDMLRAVFWKNLPASQVGPNSTENVDIYTKRSIARSKQHQLKMSLKRFKSRWLEKYPGLVPEFSL